MFALLPFALCSPEKQYSSMWKPSVALGKGLCVGLEILTELSTTFVLICMYMMAGPPGDPRGTGLAKKFVWVFSKHLQKT